MSNQLDRRFFDGLITLSVLAFLLPVAAHSDPACVQNILEKYLRAPQAHQIGQSLAAPDHTRVLEVDDFVRIGKEFAEKDLIALDRNGLPHVLATKKHPIWGRYKGTFSDGIVWVEIWDPRRRLKFEARVAESEVFSLALGSKKNLQQALAPTSRIPIPLKPGDFVRFRDAKGEMRTGFLTKRLNDPSKNWGVETVSGIQEIPTADIFLSVRPHPVSSPRYVASWLPSSKQERDGAKMLIKDAAARLTSSDSFKSLSDVEQITTLNNFVIKLMPYSRVGFAQDRNSLIKSMDDVACAGAGVCRHQSSVLGEILSETGFNSRFAYLVGTEADPGHAWFEVDLKDAAGNIETYIVDPANRLVSRVEDLDLDFKLTRSFYLSPKKQYLAPR